MENTLTMAEYKKIQDFIYDKLGLDQDDKKKETVTTKIVKIMHRRGMKSPKDYVNYILSTTDSAAIQEFFNEITTNTTEFFRESAHFDYIKNHINAIIEGIPKIRRDFEIRVWSMPCSSGEEPITTAIVLKECLPPGIKIKILATDISEKILNKASRGLYTENECKGLSKNHRLKYFDKQPDGFFKIGEDIRKCITYRLFNVMSDFKFHKDFDIIFCRNLMIYMDHDVQEQLVNKFYNVLTPNGLFFIGHSESLLNKRHSFKYIQTALFKK
ncbi:MAG: protein-glutamate O-methyltransferase CheR [Oscillospiraceae bacterium]|nr:protein-glutamate O-methyltransferase CheR [Oscillospiraceae bacterium]